MAQPKYKLTYFNLMARAEVCRLIFAAADVEYEDIRVDGQKWMTMKQNTPFGQLPILEAGEVTLAQSKTIARYLANQFGLAGKTPLERASADMIVDCAGDFQAALVKIFDEKDEAKKGELIKKYKEEQMPAFLKNFEKLLVSNNGGDGYFVGNEMSWADITMLHNIRYPSRMGITIDWTDCPKLEALVNKVESHPSIAAWIAKRPETPF